MSKLSRGEQEFLSEQGELGPQTQAPAGEAASLEADGVIDARGISPPLPLLRAHRALRAMQPGQVLKVITSAPQTMAEFQALVKYVAGYELVSQSAANGEFVHVLRRRR